MAFIAHEKTQDSYRIVNALPDGTRSGAEWEAISATMSYTEAQQALGEILIAADTPEWLDSFIYDGIDG